jgi:AbiV family abortive infection protein
MGPPAAEPEPGRLDGETMRVRAIRDLANIRNDHEFFQELSEGLSLVAENASKLNDAIELLSSQKQFRAARVLLSVAEEEAAKYLILLDAARCPRHPQHLLPRQLGYFNSHLAKGIYAEASWWRVATFDDLRQHVDRERASHYLDGPSDVDWIFRNAILRRREERLYVDYVEVDGEN